jgi:DNA polymerase I
VKDDLLYDATKVEEFMGVRPEQVVDLLALKGDTIDNIPGAPGIGDKGAKELIAQFGSVEGALDRASEVKRKMYRESLQNHREQILLSKRLVTIDTTVPIEFKLDSVRAQPPDMTTLRDLYHELEFFSLAKELGAPVEQDAKLVHSGRLQTFEEWQQYLAGIPPGEAVAIVLARGTEETLEPSIAAISGRIGEARVAAPELQGELQRLLEDSRRPKLTHDLKTLSLDLAEQGCQPQGPWRDVMLEAFLVAADPAACSLDALSQRLFNRTLSPRIEEHASFVQELGARLGPELEAKGLEEVYCTIDLPLVPVLVRMALTGIRVDTAELSRLSTEMETAVERLRSEICSLAGREFNLNSPQQLGKVLFEELCLPAPMRYGKGKIISTAADVLEELAVEHEIVRKVLEYRQVAKLKSTYVDALPALINPATGRLHTNFNQTGAATGRLSSSNPNLQNIPIRTAQGREIRAAFVPDPGWQLISADYSQIELRLLAHMSQDPLLLEAFRKGEDIHTRTSAEVFNVSPAFVTPEMRRSAKAVNFGIVYGQTPFGLATQLGISRQEADQYIRRYFARYAGVKRFIEATIAETRQTGIAKTLFGRQRPIPDIGSRNPGARSFAERTAVNTPLQGTAADLIKAAMIEIHSELDRRELRTVMLLQVHDELLFESPPEELEEVTALIKSRMETVYPLDVPLLVEVGVGANWRDAK